MFRGHATEWFGPLAGTVTTSAQIFAAVLTILLIGAGRKLFAPPGTGLQDVTPRIAGLIAVVLVVLLFIASRDAESTLSFLQVAIWAAGVLLISAIAYMVAYQLLTFKCPGDDIVFVRGLKVDRDAKRVLDNDQGPPPLPVVRTMTGNARPVDACDYFCKADRANPAFIWTRGSLVAAQLILTLLYIPLAVSIIGLLAAASLAIQQADTKIVEAPSATIAQIPADLLFDFDKADLKPEADAALTRVATMIRDNWQSGPVVVVGYTDGKGSVARNAKLSRDRAVNVTQWLATKGELAKIPFDPQGLGASAPVAPNTLPDGSDNPEGRSLNRRVVISVPRRSRM